MINHLDLPALIEHCKESKNFHRWLTAACAWAEKNGIQIEVMENDGWCIKITLRDSIGDFYDYAEPMNKRKAESDEDYADRVWKSLTAECAKIRKARIEFLTKKRAA